MSRYKLCRFCGQPMKPKGVKKKPFEYDHARGCPYARKRKSTHEPNSRSQRIRPLGGICRTES